MILRRALVVAGVLALAGCVPAPDPAASPTSKSSPAVSATATPTPTPSETPTAEDPADLGSWIIDGNGIGPIDIGSDVSLLGTYLPGITNSECAISHWQRPDGLVIAPVTGFEHDQIFGVNMSGGSTSALADAPSTAAGIGIGSTQAEVTAAYPGVPLVENGFHQPHYPVPLDGRYVVISLQDGLVSALAVSSDDTLPSDYC